MKILFLYLTGQRDKDVDTLIGSHLKQMGHEITVHPYMDAGRESVPYLKPDVVVHPFPGGQYKVDFIKKCKEWGCMVVIRRGEAGVSLRTFLALDPDRKKIILGNWPYGKYVDLELTWGQEFTNILAQHGHVPIMNMRPCGAFPFDFHFLKDCIRFRNRPKTVLFATGFSTADCVVDNCECGLPDGADLHKELYKKHTKTRAIWIKAIKELHSRFSTSWKFTLKVRPGERVTEYVKELGDIVKIYPQTYSAIEALKQTDLVVHSGSTLAMEAHLMKMPSVNFCNVNPDPMLANLAPRAESCEDLAKHFQDTDLDDTNVNWSVFYDLRHHLYGEIDGQACKRAAIEIQKLIESRKAKHHTEIPDVWPLEPLYHNDPDHIVLQDPKNSDDYLFWLCPCCKGRFWSTSEIRITDCPWCGMAIGLIHGKNVPFIRKERSVLA
jgi:surface carbohydrate biosynthesis protein